MSITKSHDDRTFEWKFHETLVELNSADPACLGDNAAGAKLLWLPFGRHLSFDHLCRLFSKQKYLKVSSFPSPLKTGSSVDWVLTVSTRRYHLKGVAGSLQMATIWVLRIIRHHSEKTHTQTSKLCYYIYNRRENDVPLTLSSPTAELDQSRWPAHYCCLQNPRQWWIGWEAVRGRKRSSSHILVEGQSAEVTREALYSVEGQPDASSDWIETVYQATSGNHQYLFWLTLSQRVQ